jgi:hypothetical protein
MSYSFHYARFFRRPGKHPGRHVWKFFGLPWFVWITGGRGWLVARLFGVTLSVVWNPKA